VDNLVDELVDKPPSRRGAIGPTMGVHSIAEGPNVGATGEP